MHAGALHGGGHGPGMSPKRMGPSCQSASNVSLADRTDSCTSMPAWPALCDMSP